MLARMLKRGITIGVLVLLGTTVAPGDETFRCGRWVVSSDLSVAELRARCGEPSSRKVIRQDIRRPAESGRGTIKVGVTTTEVWRYERGRRAAPMVVTIVDGRIRSMERAK